MYRIVSAAAIAAVIAAVIACAAGYHFYKDVHTVDLNDYLTIRYEGYEGYAKPFMSLDEKAIEQDYGSIMHEPPAGLLVKSDEEGVSDTTASFCRLYDRFPDGGDLRYDYRLKNGGSVSYIGIGTMYDESFGCWVKSESFSITARGIELLDDADPFEGLTIETAGGNSQGVAEANTDQMKQPFCDITFELSPNMYLSNGDIIKVSIPEEELQRMASVNDGYVPKKTSENYEIEGLPALTEDNAESDRKAEAEMRQREQEAEEKAGKERAEREYKARLRKSGAANSGSKGSGNDSYSYDDEDNIDPDDPDYEEGDEEFDSFDDIDYYDEGFEGEY